MHDVLKTFLTALAAVASAAVIGVWLADQAEPTPWAPAQQLAKQTMSGTPAEPASKPRG